MADLETLTVDGVNFSETTDPSTPASGKLRVYGKTTGFYYITDAGTVVGPLLDEDLHDALDHTGLTGVGGSSFAGAKAYSSSVQSFTAGQFAAFTFASEEYDSDSYHDTSSNTSRMTIPVGKAGKYLLQGGTFWNSYTGSTASYIGFRKNGTTAIRGYCTTGIAAAHYASAQAIADLAEGDYVEFMASNGSGASANLGHASLPDAQNWFAITKVG